MKNKKSNIQQVNFEEAVGDKYLSYALSTIMSRSLPDVRDGLKPVHRRILYSMLQLRLNPESGYKKCARIVGDVIGKYHPHGDVAVYDSLVRLAQNFSLRYPLIEGQGNFGSIDGDNAAAMRYTESRLSEIAILMLEDIEDNTVDFKENYDGSETEPVILPSLFPNLLANGSEGIAVGMATSIPPHNIFELCDALISLVNNPEITIPDLVKNHIKAPDFPTGGIILENESDIIKIYETGRGSMRVRAKWFTEDLGHGQYQIVISEIPYQTQKSRIIERIADLYKEKKLPNIAGISDESAEEIRIVLEPKNRTTDPRIIMEQLFKITELENKINVNMNVITSEILPRTLNLKEILQEFIAHRINIILRKSKYRLSQIDERLEIVAGLLIAYLNLDEIIRIIREEDEPKEVMMERFSLTSNQAEAILNTRLRSLRKLEEFKIREEYEALEKEKAELLDLIANDKKQYKLVIKQIEAIKKQLEKSKSSSFYKRKTIIEIPEIMENIDPVAFIEKEKITILCSEQGWIKAIKGHDNDLSKVNYKKGDREKFVINNAYNTDKILIFADNGKFYTIDAYKLNMGKGEDEAINMLLDLGSSNILEIFIYNDNSCLLLSSLLGKGFLVEMREVVSTTRLGKQIMNIDSEDGDKIAFAKTINKDDLEKLMIAIIGTNRKLIIYKLSSIPMMKKGKGVALQKYRDATISDLLLFTQQEGFYWLNKNGIKTYPKEDYKNWIGPRGGIGRIPPEGFPKSNLFG